MGHLLWVPSLMTCCVFVIAVLSAILYHSGPCYNATQLYRLTFLWNEQNALLWRHNGHDGVSNHQSHECSLNRPSRRRSKKTSKLRITGLCAWNSPETGEFPAQMASNAEKGFHLMTSSWYAFTSGLSFCIHITGLVQDCGISHVLALKIPQPCTKSLICVSVWCIDPNDFNSLRPSDAYMHQ